MNILENELVRKYFGCEFNDHDYCEIDCMTSQGHKTMHAKGFDFEQWHVADRILTAMQEPIKPGEQYLNAWVGRLGGGCEKMTWKGEKELDGLHPFSFRLPSRFQ